MFQNMSLSFKHMRSTFYLLGLPKDFCLSQNIFLDIIHCILSKVKPILKQFNTIATNFTLHVTTMIRFNLLTIIGVKQYIIV